MENKLVFTEEKAVSAGYINSSAKLGVTGAALFVQDAFTQLFGMLKCDGVLFKEKGLYWVLMKNKIKFFEMPVWNERVEISSFPVDCLPLRTHVNSEVKDSKGNTVCLANQEICLLSMENHRPVRISTVPYPDKNFPEAVFMEPFENFKVDENLWTESYSEVIRQEHIDMSHHVNNVEYIRLALNVFDCKWLESHVFDTVEVHYKGETREGETVKVFKAEVENAVYIKILQNENIVFEMKAVLK